MNATTIFGVSAITLLLLLGVAYTLWSQRPKPVKAPTLEEELEASLAEATRARISYEGEAEFALAMAEYQERRTVRLRSELLRLRTPDADEQPAPDAVMGQGPRFTGITVFNNARSGVRVGDLPEGFEHVGSAEALVPSKTGVPLS